LRVQTGADTNTGDSGSALINQDDKVIGFAFERAAFGEKPQITDWIWAANALSALGLTPV
jgi:S1-C subfamily serine protease